MDSLADLHLVIFSRQVLGIATGVIAVFAPAFSLSIAVVPERIALGHRSALVGGLALCWMALVGLHLNAADVLNSYGWWVSSLCVCAASLAIWLLRRGPGQKSGSNELKLPDLKEAYVLGAACLLVGMAISVARTGAANVAVPGYTEMWGQIVDDQLVVGVKNLEGSETAYRIDVRDGGDGAMVQSQSIAVATNSTIEKSFELARQRAASPVVANLFRQGDIEPYRKIIIWPGGGE